MNLKVRVFIPRKLAFDPNRLTRVVDNSLDATATAIQADFNVTTQTWDKRPEFKIDYRPGERHIFTEDEIYSYVNNGTQPHIIRARNAPRLVFFATGFRPKTVVKAIRSNKGRKANKDLRRPLSVMHPGNEAREFDLTISKKWDEQFPITLQRAIDAEISRGERFE